MTTNEKALQLHEEWNGKLTTESKCTIQSREDLALAYTPGVAEPCKVIAKDKEAAYKYTIKANTVAVISDGSAVLGLGNIGPYAAMPVKLLDIPVFHDDQHGTAIVVLAGIINGLRITGKKKEECKVVINGAGSAGIAITKLLLTYGFTNVTMCDINGIIGENSKDLNWMQKSMVEVTNPEKKTGTLADALVGADIFVGVSAPNIVTPEMVKTMNSDSIMFAMANPVPEIMPDAAKAAGARIVGTGRSDFPNQVNNVIAFPGIFRGALLGRASQITEKMKLAAANAIAYLVPDDKLNDDFILPEAFDPNVRDAVCKAVMDNIESTNISK